MKMQPTSYEAQNWSKDMVNYFKLKWEEDGMKDKESMQEDIEDVMEGENISAKMCSANEISGMETAVKCYCSFIYAANCGIKRRKLWNELKTASNIVSNKPWIMLGDFNVTMKVEEHSSGGSQVSSEMQDLINCPNEVEMEDINSTGLHSLKAIQNDMVQNPHNDSIKAKEAECLAEYLAALNDEEKCSLKIDIAKAYDIVDWDFLRNIPVNFGFYKKIVSWIMTCVTSAAFTIGINGERFGYFKSDDLLVLCHEDEVSVKVIKEALIEFRKSFWVIDEEAGDSGTWKALLELRDEIKPKIIHEIGNSIK
ncbi:RNA-directed DNA polymerase, eukaryota, reverse transcriptase zinc-binding domain protein, partial [Tanacetum coccineum]